MLRGASAKEGSNKLFNKNQTSAAIQMHNAGNSLEKVKAETMLGYTQPLDNNLNMLKQSSSLIYNNPNYHYKHAQRPLDKNYQLAQQNHVQFIQKRRWPAYNELK